MYVIIVNYKCHFRVGGCSQRVVVTDHYTIWVTYLIILVFFFYVLLSNKQINDIRFSPLRINK